MFLESSFLTVMKHLPYDRPSVQHFMRISPFNPQSNPNLKIMQPSLQRLITCSKSQGFKRNEISKPGVGLWSPSAVAAPQSCLAADKPSSACFSIVFTWPPLQWPFTLMSEPGHRSCTQRCSSLSRVLILLLPVRAPAEASSQLFFGGISIASPLDAGQHSDSVGHMYPWEHTLSVPTCTERTACMRTLCSVH